MPRRIKSYISHKVSSGSFSSPTRARRFALKATLLAATVGNVVDVTALAILHHFEMLPYSLSKAIHTGLMMTTVISLGVGLPVIYLICMAIHELSLSRDEFVRLSRTDALTGLLNRRAFLEALDASSGEISFALFDIDRFKSVNDTYGHHAGDRAIVSVAQTLQRVFGSDNTVGRIGGEEFAVLVFGPDPAERFATIDRARRMIEAQIVEIDDGQTLRITVSAGVTETLDSKEFRVVFAAADKALYVAKISGRNRVIHDRDTLKTGVPPAPQPETHQSEQTALMA